MSALATAPTLFDEVRGAGAERAGGEPTLDAALTARWSELGRHEHVSCLVCGEEMAPEYGAHALPIGGRCTRCGTTLR